MTHRVLGSISALAVATAVVFVAGTRITAQTPAKANVTAAKKYTPSRTVDGQPDLQGVWNFAVLTPLQRPNELAGKEFFTDQEATAFEQSELVRRDEDRRDNPLTGTTNGSEVTADVARAYNQFWWDYGTKIVGTKRTSLVVDPPDGRIPALTPDGKKKQAALAARREGAAAGPEDRSPSERCIQNGKAGPPILPAGYNNNIQVVQTPGYVAIMNEQIHDVRLIPLDGRPHLDRTIGQWMGDSRGRWEGDTLVVDTTNFNGQVAFQGSGENLHLIERFTRADANTLLYEFTVEDPASFTKSWTAQLPMTKTQGPIYEYACHEGNYGMFGILNSARATERAAGEAAKKGSR
jgi:hypothetical protein